MNRRSGGGFSGCDGDGAGGDGDVVCGGDGAGGDGDGDVVCGGGGGAWLDVPYAWTMSAGSNWIVTLANSIRLETYLPPPPPPLHSPVHLLLVMIVAAECGGGDLMIASEGAYPPLLVDVQQSRHQHPHIQRFHSWYYPSYIQHLHFHIRQGHDHYYH